MTLRPTTRFVTRHPRIAAVATALALLLLASVSVLFGWNSFAVPVLDLGRLQLREALGLTLLLTVCGRLLAPRHTRRDNPERRP